MKLTEREELFDLVVNRALLTKYRLILLGTGLRPGEALALRWIDLDLRAGSEHGVMHVCGTVVRHKGGKSFRQDKRKGGGRPYYLVLPMWLTLVLRDWKVSAGDVHESDHVLLSRRGGLVSSPAAEQLLQKVVDGISLEWVTFGNSACSRSRAAIAWPPNPNSPKRIWPR